ncbi:MAG: universal stress protein [Myxococcales bacterium]|nr:universal stress protein [Myxococcales bacterium]
MLQDILVPVDGSVSAGRAARWGAFLASETKARITFLFVYDAGAASSMGFKALTAEQLELAKQSVAKGSFDQAREQAKEFDVEKRYEIVVGHPQSEILGWVQQHHPQLIVMGTRGLSPLREILLGSVSDFVARHAPCPVTLVR